MTTTQAKNKKRVKEAKTGGRKSFYVSVFLFKNGQLVQKYSSHQKSRVWRFLQMSFLPESKIDHGLLQVSYIPRKEVFNAAKFEDLEAYKKAIEEFTEPELLKHIAEGSW